MCNSNTIRLNTEREVVRRELVELEKQMQAFIAEESKKQSDTQTLDHTLIETVAVQAKALGFDL